MLTMLPLLAMSEKALANRWENANPSYEKQRLIWSFYFLPAAL